MPNPKIFSTGAVHERKIKLMDGSEEPMWFRELPNTAFERYAIQSNSDSEDVAALASAKLLVAGVCEPTSDDGKFRDALTLDEATRIINPVKKRMLAALLDVNGHGPSAAKQIESQAKKP